MNYTIGDGITALALAGGIVGCLHTVHQSRRKRLEIIHQERLIAMEKGIPLPEFPPERTEDAENAEVIPILGTVLLTLSIGTMIVLYVNLEPPGRGFWVAPLPFAFLGVGFLAIHFLKRESSR